jgi:hypothetical protein
MPIFDQETIIGKILPRPYVDRIVLEYAAQQPPNQDNPHIDDARENEDGSGDDSSLKVTLDISLKEVIEQDFIGRWFLDENIKRFLKLRIIQSTKKEISDELLSANTAAVISNIRRLSPNFGTLPEEITIKEIPLSFGNEGSNSEIVEKYSEIDNDGNSVFNVPFKVVFDLEQRNPKHLSYFAIVHIDLESLAEEYDFTLSNANGITLSQNGELAVENVIDQFNTVSESVVYYRSDGTIWPGSVHSQEEQNTNDEIVYQWYTFSSPLPQSEPLVRRRVPTTKVQDFRDIEEIKKLQVDLSYLDVEQKRIQSNIYALKRDNMAAPKTASAFSDLFLASSRSGAARFAFTVDYYQLLRDASVYKKLYDIASEQQVADILSYGKIRYMKVLRRRIQKRTILNSLGYPTEGNVLFDRKEPSVVIATGYQLPSPTNIFEGSNTEIGGLRELDISVQQGQPGIKFFTGIDKSMIDVTDGFYQYGVEVEVEDGTLEYINRIYLDLSQAQKDLQQYYDDGTKLGTTKYVAEVQDPHIDNSFEKSAVFRSSPGSYNPLSNRFTSAFIKQQRDKYSGASEILAPWFRSVASYIIGLSLLTPIDSTQTNNISQKLMMFTMPETANPRSVLAVLNLIDSFLTKIEKLTTTVGSRDRNESGNVGPTRTPSATGGTAIRTKTYNYWFIDETFDSNQLKNYGLDYLSKVEGSSSQQEVISDKSTDQQPGLRIVGGQEYSERVNKETLKYYNSANPNIDIKVGNKFVNGGDNIDNTSFGFLTPSFCYLGTETKSFLEQGNSPNDKAHDYDYYALAVSQMVRYNTFGTPGTKQRVDSSDGIVGKNAQQLRNNMMNNYSVAGLTIEPVRRKGIIPNSDNELGPRKVNFVENSATLDLDIVEDRIIDPLEKDIVDGNITENIGYMRGVNPNATLLSIGADLTRTGYTNRTQLPRAQEIRKTGVKEYEGGVINTDSIKFMNVNSDRGILKFLNSKKRRKGLAKSLGMKTNRDMPTDQLLKFLPNQLKSLMVDSANSGEAKSLLDATNKEPITDPETSPFFQINFSMINQIEVLTGYEKSTMRIKNPIWKTLTFDIWNKAVGSALLCRMKNLKLSFIGVGKYKGLEFPTYDEFFLLTPAETIQNRPLPPIGDPNSLRSDNSSPILSPNQRVNRNSVQNDYLVRIDRLAKTTPDVSNLKSVNVEIPLITRRSG